MIRVLDARLDDGSPCIILESVGTITMAAAVGADGPRPGEEAIELVRTVAGVLEDAHRLGLAHGRLGPGQVFLVDGRPRLDFTGIDAGFPVGSTSARMLDLACRDSRASGGPASDRAADLYGLGVLIVWLLTGGTSPADRASCIAGRVADSRLGDLVRELLADEPADRPSAREVRERLSGTASDAGAAPVPFDATDDWSAPAAGLVPSSWPTRPGKSDSLIVGFGLKSDIPAHGTLVLDAGCPRLGRYRLLDKLGEGGQGIVYRAEDPAQGITVAIKVLRSDRADDATVLRRFRKEARLMAEANNPQVVNLLEFNEEDGIPYLVLEFVAGDSLSGLLTDRARL